VLALYPNVRLIQGDILKLLPKDLITEQDYIVVANIPYYITSVVIRHLLENTPKPRRVVLTIQEEVAERICAKPGDMSLLALSVQVYGEPRIAARIPAEAFFPAPKVDSAVLRVDIYPTPLVKPEVLESFFKLIKAGFSQKRKTLRNSLSSGLRIAPSSAADFLTRAGIDPQRRAEALSIEEWERLSESIK
jgi:16S rRNA (adenine1518-N6/adenine1519-N6)-dimethyltransferase